MPTSPNSPHGDQDVHSPPICSESCQSFLVAYPFECGTFHVMFFPCSVACFDSVNSIMCHCLRHSIIDVNLHGSSHTQLLLVLNIMKFDALCAQQPSQNSDLQTHSHTFRRIWVLEFVYSQHRCASLVTLAGRTKRSHQRSMDSITRLG